MVKSLQYWSWQAYGFHSFRTIVELKELSVLYWYFLVFFFLKAFEREVQAHRAVDHPNVLLLHDYDVVTKGTYKEARMLVAYYKVKLVWDKNNNNYDYCWATLVFVLLDNFHDFCLLSKNNWFHIFLLIFFFKLSGWDSSRLDWTDIESKLSYSRDWYLTHVQVTLWRHSSISHAWSTDGAQRYKGIIILIYSSIPWQTDKIL